MLEGIKNLLSLVTANWALITVIIGLGIGIYARVKTYLKLTNDQKVNLAFTSVSKIILDLVTNAQDKFGVDMNVIKRSNVLSAIYSQFPILTEVMDQDTVTAKIDKLIDDAIAEMKEVLAKKAKSETPVTEVSGIEISTIDATNTDGTGGTLAV